MMMLMTTTTKMMMMMMMMIMMMMIMMMMMMMITTYGFVSRNTRQKKKKKNYNYTHSKCSNPRLGFTSKHQHITSVDFRTRLKRPNLKKSVITQDSMLSVDFFYSNIRSLDYAYAANYYSYNVLPYILSG